MIKNIFKIAKIIGALSVVALLAGQVLSAPLKIAADSPRFNFLDGDKELFTGLNKTAGDTVYTDPVTSNGDDEIVGLIYYHNGVVGTTATNTTVNVTLPPTTDSLAKTLSASITADNTDPQTISDTTLNGNVIGQSGLTINVPTGDAKVSFIEDSVRWFPDQSLTAVDLPTGIDGNDIVTSKGLNIGDIQGCWQFSGFISLRFKVETPKRPVILNIEKTVSNESLAQPFSDSNTARPEDILNYNIVIKNTGTSNADEVFARDYLPEHVTLLPNTIRLYVHGSDTPSPFPDANGSQFINSAVSIGDLPMGDAMFSKITFSAKIDLINLSDGQVLTNKAEATFETQKVSDEARTTLVVTSPMFQQSKSALNETQNIDATKNPANPGDVITYSLSIKNIGTAAGSYTFEDGIADVLEYSNVDRSRLNGGSIVERSNASLEDDRIVIVYPEIENIQPGETKTAQFTVIVKKPLPTNPSSGNHYDFVMYNIFGNPVIIHIKPPIIVNPALTLVKDVRDVSANNTTFTDQNTISAGDILEYRLIITNPTTVPADGVKIVDTLPANFVYQVGTTVLSVNGTAATLVDGITGNGIIFPQIPANSVYTIYLRAKADSGVASGACLVNLATVTSGSINISDQAKSCVEVITPPVTPPSDTNLPVTGASGVMASVFGSLFALTNILYFSGKKKLLATAILAHC